VDLVGAPDRDAVRLEQLARRAARGTTPGRS
jgi:hypothetical protein